MIATLTGKVTQLQFNSLVLEVAGVGYEVFCDQRLLAQLKLGQLLSLFTYEQIREDIRDLYGFSEAETKLLFSQLISISGVGPKLALAIISTHEPQLLRDAIAAGDSQILEAVPGVGKKTAARIVIDLKNKVVGDALSLVGRSMNRQDLVMEALRQLGYSQRSAQAAMAKLSPDLKSDEERIRAALKIISH